MRRRLAAVLLLPAVVIAGIWLLRDEPALVPGSASPSDSRASATRPERDIEADAASLPAAGVVADCSAVYREQLDSLYDGELTAERVEQIIEEARTTYRYSGESYLQVFAAMLIDDPAERIELYSGAILAGNDSPFLLWSAVNACLAAFDRVECPARDWLQRLLAVDSENSEVWMRLAYLRHRAGEKAAALDAVQRAAIAYESDSYWRESVASARAGIDAIGGYSQATAAINAIGMAAAYPGPDANLVQLCRDQSARDRMWASACRAFGRQTAALNQTIMNRRIGRGIEADALIASGEAEDSEQIRELRRLPELARDDELMRYPDSVSVYFDALISYGEVAAIAALREYNETMKRSGQPVDCGDIRLD